MIHNAPYAGIRNNRKMIIAYPRPIVYRGYPFVYSW